VTEPQDPYEVLQVASTADDAVLRAAYRALAQRLHPDVAGPSGEGPMRELNAAWEIVGDPVHRAEYDLARAASRPGQSPRATATAEPARGAGADPTRRAAPEPMAAAGQRRPRSTPPWTGAAGPAPGRPSGSVLDFGIYCGWSLGEIARQDAGYLEWLETKPDGRRYAAEIDALLQRLGMRAPRPVEAAAVRRGGRRIFGR
jgi:curved DNA-binding protein CbpA